MYGSGDCEVSEVAGDGTVCTGSDGGVDYYTSGSLLVKSSDTPTATISGDEYCFDSSIELESGITYKEFVKTVFENEAIIENKTSGKYLFETTCASQTINGEKDYALAVIYNCPNGCSDGVCIGPNPAVTVRPWWCVFPWNWGRAACS